MKNVKIKKKKKTTLVQPNGDKENGITDHIFPKNHQIFEDNYRFGREGNLLTNNKL